MRFPLGTRPRGARAVVIAFPQTYFQRAFKPGSKDSEDHEDCAQADQRDRNRFPILDDDRERNHEQPDEEWSSPTYDGKHAWTDRTPD